MRGGLMLGTEVLTAGKEGLTGWGMGFVIATVVLVVVVALIAAILKLAQHIGWQAYTAVGGLDGVRQNTLPLWDIQQTNIKLQEIIEGVAQAHEALRG
jgi:hypothetical protein